MPRRPGRCRSAAAPPPPRAALARSRPAVGLSTTRMAATPSALSPGAGARQRQGERHGRTGGRRCTGPPPRRVGRHRVRATALVPPPRPLACTRRTAQAAAHRIAARPAQEELGRPGRQPVAPLGARLGRSRGAGQAPWPTCHLGAPRRGGARQRRGAARVPIRTRRGRRLGPGPGASSKAISRRRMPDRRAAGPAGSPAHGHAPWLPVRLQRLPLGRLRGAGPQPRRAPLDPRARG